MLLTCVLYMYDKDRSGAVYRPGTSHCYFLQKQVSDLSHY